MKGIAAFVVALSLVVPACADELPRQSPPEFVEEAPPGGRYPPDPMALPEIMPGTPANGYIDWVADLRAGLARVEADATASEREESLRLMQDLYATRHEYLEHYFGRGGALFVGDGMAEAVARSAAELHDLMRRLADPAEDASRLRDTIRAADQALYDVEAEGRAAGLSPTAPHGDG